MSTIKVKGKNARRAFAAMDDAYTWTSGLKR
jgi:hypothetical protein